MGQLFSTRSDLFPAAFTEELAKLQDRVPAFAPVKAKAIIEAELGAPVQQLFRSFQEQPIAAASLGQVPTMLSCSCASCSPVMPFGLLQMLTLKPFEQPYL